MRARRRFAGPALLLLPVCMPAVALAQQPPATAAADATITVTATRVARPDLEVPASIDRLDADQIRFARQQVNLSESLGRVPGIVVQNRQNYAQDLQISSRGFGARSTFGVRGLRLNVDGIPASMPDGQGQVSSIDLGSARSIEVLRGPFAVMYGNASGGVINVTSDSGSDVDGILGRLELGSYGSARVSLEAGARSGGADWMASAAHFGTDGYRAHSAARRDQLNAKLRWGLGTRTLVTVVASAFASPDTQDPGGLTQAELAADPRQAGSSADKFNTRKGIAQNQIGATLMYRLDTATLEAAVYAGHRGIRQYLGFPGATPATTSGGVVDLDRGYGGASLRLSRAATLAGRPLTLTLGSETERQDERRKGFVNLNGDLGALRRDEDDLVTETAVYAQAEWRFAAKWIALAGLRVNRVRFSSADHYVIAGNPDDSGARRFGATTPVAGLLYRVSPATSVYATLGRGFETPTFAEMAYRPGGTGLNFALEPSRSRHLEAGIKSYVTANLRVRCALFDVQTHDEIVVDANVGGRSTYRNAGRTRRGGAELSAEATLPLGFEAALAWTAVHARFRDAFGGVAAGNRLPGVPRQSLYGELRWRHRPSGFSAVLEAQHRSRVAVNDANSEFADGYSVANLALAFAQEMRRWRLSEFLRVDNLTDKHTVGSVIVNESNGRYYEPAPGRNATLGVEAKIDF